MKESVTEILANYVAETEFDDLPDEVVDKAIACIRDSIGCALGGYRTTPGRIVANLVTSLGGTPESTIMGTGAKVGCVNASFANSTLSNALDFDDCFPGGHPGSTIVPPALAVSERIGAPGKKLILATVVGYEVSTRIGRSIRPTKKRIKKVFGLGTWQVFGSVAAASKLLSLSQEEVANAFGIAGSDAPVPSNNKTMPLLMPRMTMSKNNFGAASQAGVMAALLAKKGFTGPCDILDGETGFWRIAGSDRCDFKMMTAGLGKDYLTLEVEFKPYSCCRWLHNAIDAVLELTKENEIQSKSIKKITARTFSNVVQPRHSNYTPRTMMDVIPSLPYCVAVALAGIEPGPKWFANENLTDRKLLRIAARVKPLGDCAAERTYPDKSVATVEIETFNGGRYSKRVEYAKGHPKNPMSEREMAGKFVRLASLSVSATKAKETRELIKRLRELSDVRKIARLVGAPEH